MYIFDRDWRDFDSLIKSGNSSKNPHRSRYFILPQKKREILTDFRSQISYGHHEISVKIFQHFKHCLQIDSKENLRYIQSLPYLKPMARLWIVFDRIYISLTQKIIPKNHKNIIKIRLWDSQN